MALYQLEKPFTEVERERDGLGIESDVHESRNRVVSYHVSPVSVEVVKLQLVGKG